MAIDLSKLVYANSQSPYIDAFAKLKSSLQAQRNTDVARMNANQKTDLQKSNAGYNNTASQNYINYMQAQRRLPNELNALGIRGGASESSLIRLGTNYGSNVASNEAARQNALAAIREAYAKQIGDYDRDLSERLASAEATARQNEITWEREQVDKDLERFSGAIEGLYKKKSSYQALIKKLQESNDPNKAYKIMLARRAMNQLNTSSSSGGGGGGGSSRSYGGGGYSSGGSSGGGGSSSSSSSSNSNPVSNAISSSTSILRKIAEDAIKANNKRSSNAPRYGATR